MKTSTIFEVSTFGISEAITSKIRNPSPDSSSVVANTSIREATQGFQFQRSVNRNSTVRNTTYIGDRPEERSYEKLELCENYQPDRNQDADISSCRKKALFFPIVPSVIALRMDIADHSANISPIFR